MNNEFKIFTQIIRECSYDNTYKMAWAKSLVELSTEVNLNDDIVTFTFDQIANKYLKYYWNQTIHFDLRQGSNPNKPPTVVTLVKKLIEIYHSKVGSNIPILFDRVNFQTLDLDNEYNYTIKSIRTKLKEDVSWRFKVIDKVSHDELYELDKRNYIIKVPKSLLTILRDNDVYLYDMINYRWGLILETFNSSPRINKKVKIMDEREIKRNSLNKFKLLIELENPEHKCFICNKIIDKKELTIDHVIPWSYLYSDDIWNLVYVCKGCNSSKSNKIPEEDTIDKLLKRNTDLLEIIEDIKKYGDTKIKESLYSELKLAIDSDYVQKFWISCKQ